MKKLLHPIKKWTPAKVKAVMEATMALGAMVGVPQEFSFWEIRLPSVKHSPIYLVYSEDFVHGVSWKDGRITHHSDVSKNLIGDHFAEWAEMGALE